MTLKLAIIGGGAAGLASLQAILDSEEHKSGKWMVTLFEEREDIGGIWLPAEHIDNPPKTPLYDSLTTNIPHPVMAYESLMFPPETPLFPRASIVLQYLKTYAAHNRLWPHIRLSTSVTRVQWVGKHWIITLSDRSRAAEADRLIIANGHFRVPLFPPIPGLEEWRKRGLITHALWYRRPTYHGNIIAVVGGGPSGRDISRDYLDAGTTVVHCVRGQAPIDDGRVKLRGAVVRFLSNRLLQFEDGTRYGPVDHVMLATGYEMSAPFLPSMVKGLPHIAPFPTHLVNAIYSLFPLAKFMFPIQEDYPSYAAAFVGLPGRVAPFPIMEAQARAVVQVFRNPASLDVTVERERIQARFTSFANAGRDEVGIAHDWQSFVDLEQFEYRDELYQFSGDINRRVENWVKEMYSAKDVLRPEWADLERKGEAQHWIKGVGYGGLKDWIQLMRRVLERAEHRI